MSMKKLFIYALLTAILAGIVTLITWPMNGWPTIANKSLTYISFIAWASYFLFGANVKAAIKAFTSIVAGIVAAILIFVLSLAFGYTPLWAVPLAVAILVVPMMMAEKVEPINNVAAIFMGTGIYFSLSAAGCFEAFTLTEYVVVGLAELFYILIGFVAGWITIQFNIMVSKNK